MNKVYFTIFACLFCCVTYAQALRSISVDDRELDACISCRVDSNADISFECQVKNYSNVTLDSKDGFFLTYIVFNGLGDVVGRGKLDIHNLQPETTSVVSGVLKAPSVDGTYKILFDIHQDWIRTLDLNVVYTIRVGNSVDARSAPHSPHRFVRHVLSEDTNPNDGLETVWLVAYSEGDRNRLFPYGSALAPTEYLRIRDEATLAKRAPYWTRLAVADLDGNGYGDVVVGSYGPVSGIDSRVRVFYFDENGRSENESIFPMAIVGHVEQIVVADFDNDGLLDLFIPTYQRFYLLRNLGDGKFQDVSERAGVVRDHLTYPKPEGAEAVDLNFDGKVDLVVGTRIFLNIGNFMFSDASEALGLPVVFDEGVKVADLDNDGDFDLAVHCLTGKGCPAYQTYWMEDGRYVLKAIDSLRKFDGCQFSGVNTMDFNSDGYEDLFFGTTGQTGCQANMFFVNLGGQAFSHEPELVQSTGSIVSLVRVDINGDLVSDFGAMDRSGNLSVYLAEPQQDKPMSKFSIALLDGRGKRTMYGAAIHVTTPSGKRFARHVEGGGGYITMNQYPITINYPEVGEYKITAYFDGVASHHLLSKSGAYVLDRNGIRPTSDVDIGMAR